jgi:hypothetical protein
VAVEPDPWKEQLEAYEAAAAASWENLADLIWNWGKSAQEVPQYDGLLAVLNEPAKSGQTDRKETNVQDPH